MTKKADLLQSSVLKLTNGQTRGVSMELALLVVRYIKARAAKNWFMRNYHEKVAQLMICNISPEAKAVIEAALQSE